MEQTHQVLEAFRQGTRATGGRRTIACLKRALRRLGVISSDLVAPGTPFLTRPDAERFDEVFDQVRDLAAKHIRSPWVSVPPKSELEGE
jgi:hypothetical protein